MKFLYKPINNKRQIGKRRKHSDIKYIVIHDTGNTSRGSDADAHYRYLQAATRYGSAHYYLDDKQIIQTIGDSLVAWSIGDKWGYKNNPRRITDATNSNSLSIELCINADINKDLAYKNLVELTKNLMKKFNIPHTRVIRHFDATGKNCPGSWSGNNWQKWKEFQDDIKKPIEWDIDLSKNSEFGSTLVADKKENGKVVDALQDEFKKAIEMGITDGSRPKDPASRQEVACMVLRGIRISNGEKLPNLGYLRSNEPTWTSKYFKSNDLDFIETDADNIEIGKLENTPLSKANKSGINGTFYSIGGNNIFGVAMQDGKPLAVNSFVSNFVGLKRGTIWYDGKKMNVDRIYNTKTEIKTPIKWAISGIMLYPSYNPGLEGFNGKYADVLRRCNHTAIGFKENKIYLIVGKDLSLLDFRNKILNSKVAFDGIIALDGGGSTQMKFKGKDILRSPRVLNHGVFLKE